MYAYNKKSDRKKVVALACAIILLCGFGFLMQWYLTRDNDKITPIISEKDEIVIKLPDKEESIIAPYTVEANIVLEYFDGSDHEVNDYTNFNGVYRPNQGIDYAYNDESFDVICMIGGKVSAVKEDETFGKTITVTSDQLVITYQSLDALNFKEGDTIKQGDVIAKASVNAYNPELGNHVHIVVEKNGTIIDPKTIIGKSLATLDQ